MTRSLILMLQLKKGSNLGIETWFTVMSGIRLSLVITGLMETRLSEEDIATNF